MKTFREAMKAFSGSFPLKPRYAIRMAEAVAWLLRKKEKRGKSFIFAILSSEGRLNSFIFPLSSQIK